MNISEQVGGCIWIFSACSRAEILLGSFICKECHSAPSTNTSPTKKHKCVKCFMIEFYTKVIVRTAVRAGEVWITDALKVMLISLCSVMCTEMHHQTEISRVTFMFSVHHLCHINAMCLHLSALSPKNILVMIHFFLQKVAKLHLNLCCGATRPYSWNRLKSFLKNKTLLAALLTVWFRDSDESTENPQQSPTRPSLQKIRTAK